MSEPVYDMKEQLAAITAGLLEGENVLAVYDAKGTGTGYIGLTDLRVILQDESLVGGKVALTSIPYHHIHTVSLVSNKSFLGGFAEAATIAIATSGHTFEIELRGHDKAKHTHDLILHFLTRG